MRSIAFVTITWRDNVASSPVAVSQLRGNGELPLLANTHILESLVPALDYLTDAQLECERLVTVVTEKTTHHESRVTQCSLSRQHIGERKQAQCCYGSLSS